MVFNGENKSVFGTIKSEDAALWVGTSVFFKYNTRKYTFKTQKYDKKVIDINQTKPKLCYCSQCLSMFRMPLT